MTSLDSKSRRTRVKDRGAAAVEFALLLPVLLLIVFGIIDFGRMMNAQITITEAAREGARAEAFGADPDERVQDATTQLGTVTTDVQSSCPDADVADVRVNYDFSFATPLGPIMGLFGGGDLDDTITLTGKGVMPCFES